MDWIIPLLIGIVLTIILGSLLYKPAPAPAAAQTTADLVIYPSSFTYPYIPYSFNQYPYRPYPSPRSHLIGPDGCLGGKCGGGHLIGPNGCLGGKCHGGHRGRLN
jgi:hypothetical protein